MATVALVALTSPGALSAWWPVGLVGGSPVGFQVQVLKVGVLDVSFNACTPQGGARGSESPRLWVPCGVWD